MVNHSASANLPGGSVNLWTKNAEFLKNDIPWLYSALRCGGYRFSNWKTDFKHLRLFKNILLGNWKRKLRMVPIFLFYGSNFSFKTFLGQPPYIPRKPFFITLFWPLTSTTISGGLGSEKSSGQFWVPHSLFIVPHSKKRVPHSKNQVPQNPPGEKNLSPVLVRSPRKYPFSIAPLPIEIC